MTDCFKPAQLIHLLEIKEQKFRYWREKLDPNPYRSEYSIMDLLAFRIIMVLIEKRNFSVNQLEKFKLLELFEWCHLTDIEKIRRSILEIHKTHSIFTFVDHDVSPDLNDYDADYIALKRIVHIHFERIHMIGCDNWRKRVFDARAKIDPVSFININSL